MPQTKPPAVFSPQDALEALIARGEEGSITAQERREALRRFEQLTLPKFPLGRMGLQPSTLFLPDDSGTPSPDDDAENPTHPQGVSISPFRHARTRHPVLFAGAFGRALGALDDPLTALAFALQNSGRFIHVPAGVTVSEPIHITYDVSERFPYTLVFLGEGARATIIEETLNEKSVAPGMLCGITEIVLSDRAHLTHASLQQCRPEDRFFMTRRARCGADARITWATADLGGLLARTALRTTLDQPGADAETVALFFAHDHQHIDLTIDIDHLVGPTHSNTLVKSVATDAASGRALGNILIRKAAHGAAASLRDDALLLSKQAHIDAIPALEIAANDVKAYHGAAVGSIDEEELFYASSRGIPRAEAERMIALGFFEPAIERFPGNALRERLRGLLAEKLG